jgi:hypothetical protein
VTLARILLSARDPGGAAQVLALTRTLRADPRVEVVLAASGAGLEVLRAAGEAPLGFALPGGATHVPPGGDTAALLGAARELLARVEPDAIVVGISSLGVGLDEALLASAGARPTFALQDYPGDANAIAGAFAGLYFVRDAYAARLTRARHGAAALPVGSLRHAGYATLDVAGLRRATRARLGVSEPAAVVGFFGQPDEIPGQDRAFADLAAALSGLEPGPRIVLRAHPKSPELRTTHLAAVAAAGLVAHDATGAGEVEPWLAACDLVTTCFSHCSMDYAFLSAASAEPLGSALFLLTAPETREFLGRSTGSALPDGVPQGLGRVAEDASALPGLVRHLLAPEARAAYHEASRRLPRTADVRGIVETILAAVPTASGGRTGR